MYLVVLIFGILVDLSCVSGTTGVIDISDVGQRSLFSGPSKLGEAMFYKLTCNYNGSYSNVFDGSERLFPIRSHTRLVGLVLATKNESPELLQVMYSDVAKDYSYRSLYYFKDENHWKLTDSVTYKSHLLKLKNNQTNFNIKDKHNKFFYTHNTENSVNGTNNTNNMDKSVQNGTTRYYLKDGMELDKVCNGDVVIWENDLKYDFKYLELSEGLSGPESLTIHYSNHHNQHSNYFSNYTTNDLSNYLTNSFQHYKKIAGRWVHDLLTTNINFSNKNQENDTTSEDKVERQNISDLIVGVKRLFLKDALNLDVENPMAGVVLNLKSDEKFDCNLTVNGYQYYGLSTYELLQPSGCNLTSIFDQGDVIFEHDNEYTSSYFQVAKFNFTNRHPNLLVSVTESNTLSNALTSDFNNTIKNTFHIKSYPRQSDDPPDNTNTNSKGKICFYSKIKYYNIYSIYNNSIYNYMNNSNIVYIGVWECVEFNLYNRLLNDLLQLVTSLEMKKLFDSPPVTVNVTPSTPSLDYGGLEPFTYDLSNPVEPRLEQDFVLTEPDLIKMKPQPGYAVNVIVDGDNVLWEQTVDGPGCHLVFIYRSENSLLSHIVTNSNPDPHFFFKFNGQSWYPISRDQYEDFKLKDTKGKGKKQHYDEYSSTLTDNSNTTTSDSEKMSDVSVDEL
ncbi:uncharacterized protein TA03300 [Theileria annulata]|uniref:SfiI-subtelomeric related protein family member n=1 Tax=Theileria annulata TaxID=5874 RepID=Q4UCN4_THEAN|nr:uncharacterized protein TA03300 [Theileria annulata]CAI75417.1 hypothetical protein TA03300 [Theileria annulata]|eukprot:XP_954893.1 hypothetical protein TA03300 [Theileria annulata]